MKLKNLSIVYVYSQVPIKEYGETTIKWQYKGKYKLNVQQDINELDTNSAGIIDYDRLKIRSDYDIDIEKNDGISLYELNIKDKYTEEPPKYRVISNPKVGNTTTITCEIYHGE